MDVVCRRLLPMDATLRFISPFLAKEHIQRNIDDNLRTYYGIYDFFLNLRLGRFRAYGVFNTGAPFQFYGFTFGYLDDTGETFEDHAFWDRGVDAAACTLLCRDFMVDEFARDGIAVTSAVGYIPDRNRAAQRMAKRVGAVDKGIRPDKLFLKDGKLYPCREFRLYMQERKS